MMNYYLLLLSFVLVYFVSGVSFVYDRASALNLTMALDIAPRINCDNYFYNLVLSFLIKHLNVIVSHKIYSLFAVAELFIIGKLLYAMIGEVKGRFLAVSTCLVVLATSLPFMSAEQSMNPVIIHELIFLVCLFGVLIYSQYSSYWMLLLAGLLYGAGMSQYETMILFLPLITLAVLTTLYYREHLHFRYIFPLILCFTIGAAAYFLIACSFYQSQAYYWREFTSYWQVMRIIFSGQYHSLLNSLPPQGWIITLIITTVPCAVVMIFGKRAISGERGFGLFLLHVILTAMSILVLFNVKFSPWAMFGYSNILLMPYVLAAFVFGYLVGYWICAPSLWFDDSRVRYASSLVKYGGYSMAGVMIACTCFAAFVNYRKASVEGGVFTEKYIEETLKSVDAIKGNADEIILFADGSVDYQLLLKTYEKKQKIKIISLAMAGNSVYQKYMASLFDDVAIKYSARIGFKPLVNSLSIAKNRPLLFIQIYPEMISQTNCNVLPQKTIFVAVDKDAPVDPDALFAEHERFWASYLPLLPATNDVGNPMLPLASRIRMQISCVANNLGVLMEDSGKTDKAFACYKKAYEISGCNVSSIINLSSLMEKGYLAEKDFKNKILNEKNDLFEKANIKPMLPYLQNIFGTIQSVDVYMDLDKLSEYRVDGARPLKYLQKAAELDIKNITVQVALAEMYVMASQRDKAKMTWNNILSLDPKNKSALTGLAKIFASEGDNKRALNMYDKALNAGASQYEVESEINRMRIADKDYDVARKSLMSLAELNPQLPGAWMMLVDMFYSSNDFDRLKEIDKRIGALSEVPAVVKAYAEAHVALRENRLNDAQRIFNRLVATSPDNLYLKELLLSIELRLNKLDIAQSIAAEIASSDRNNGLANQVLALKFIDEKEYGLAEYAYTLALAKRRSAEVLNDYAWLLANTERLDEAEAMARECVAGRNDLAAFWDTLGFILIKKNKYEEAKTMLDKAVSMMPEDPAFRVHRAYLLLKTNSKEDAGKDIANVGGSQLVKLSNWDKDLYFHVRSSLKQ